MAESEKLLPNGYTAYGNDLIFTSNLDVGGSLVYEGAVAVGVNGDPLFQVLMSATTDTDESATTAVLKLGWEATTTYSNDDGELFGSDKNTGDLIFGCRLSRVSSNADCVRLSAAVCRCVRMFSVVVVGKGVEGWASRDHFNHCSSIACSLKQSPVVGLLMRPSMTNNILVSFITPRHTYP